MSKTFISDQAQHFRSTYRVSNSKGRLARKKQLDLIVEEFREFLDADSLLYKNHIDAPAACLKELADLCYVCWQYAENMGWDLDEALNRVHLSNMSKLDEDGNPIFREDGKVLKGPNYRPPDLTDLI